MRIHVALRQRGWSGRTCEKTHVVVFLLGVPLKKFFALFFGSRRARKSGPILTIYTSYDMFPPQDVPFGGLIRTAPHFGGTISQKTPILRA